MPFFEKQICGWSLPKLVRKEIYLWKAQNFSDHKPVCLNLQVEIYVRYAALINENNTTFFAEDESLLIITHCLTLLTIREEHFEQAGRNAPSCKKPCAR